MTVLEYTEREIELLDELSRHGANTTEAEAARTRLEAFWAQYELEPYHPKTGSFVRKRHYWH